MEKWKMKILVIGGSIGLISGLVAGYLYIKNQENSPEQKLAVTSGDKFKIGIDLVSLLKRIAELGQI